MGSRKARDVAIVIPNRIGRGGHPFRMAIAASCIGGSGDITK
jgi:hypothetical protein